MHTRTARSKGIISLCALFAVLSLLFTIPADAYAAELSDSDIYEPVVSVSDVSSSDGVSASDVPLSPWECEKAQCLAALLVDETNGQTVLYEKKAHERIYPASTTKIMTALLVIEAVERGEISLEDEVVADAVILTSVIYDASHVHPRIKIDEKLTVENYLYCVMIESDCVCCNILGRHVAGSIDNFVDLMNRRAADLGCEDTHFVNTHGYPADDHYSTAWSLYLIAREAMRHETFRKICSTNEYTIPESNKYKERKLKNTNWLLGMPEKTDIQYDADYSFADCIGIKTGYSSQAGSCLVSCAERGGRTLYCVVLGAWAIKLEDGTTRRRSFSESKRLLEWGYDNFDVHTCIKQGTMIGECPVTGGGYTTSVKLCALGSVSAFLPKDLDYTSLDYDIELHRNVLEAPFMKGTSAGTVRFYHDGRQVAEAELVTADRVNLPSKLELFMMRVNGTDKDFLRLEVSLVMIAFMVLLWIIVLIAGSAQRKREQRIAVMNRKQYEYEYRYRR